MQWSSTDKKGAVGIGMSAVRFDTKIKLTDKSRGSVFIDPEGQLDLPEIARVNRVYAFFRLAKKHTLEASYFAVKRETTFIDQEIITYQKGFFH